MRGRVTYAQLVKNAGWWDSVRKFMPQRPGGFAQANPSFNIPQGAVNAAGRAAGAAFGMRTVSPHAAWQGAKSLGRAATGFLKPFGGSLAGTAAPKYQNTPQMPTTPSQQPDFKQPGYFK